MLSKEQKQSPIKHTGKPGMTILYPYHVSLVPGEPRWILKPDLHHFKVFILPDQRPSPDSGVIFLHRLQGLEHKLGYSIAGINTGTTIEIIPQFSVTNEDAVVLDTAFHYTYPGARLEPGDDILAHYFRIVAREREIYREFEFEFRDIQIVEGNLLYHSGVTFMAAAASLLPSEIILQDVVLRSGETRQNQDGIYYAVIRSCCFARQGRRENLLNAMTFDQDKYKGKYYSWADYASRGITGKAIADMFSEHATFRHGNRYTAKTLGNLFYLPWCAPSFDSMNVRVQKLQGAEPHPSLLAPGVRIGYSLFKSTRDPINIPLQYLTSSVYIVGHTGFGKSTLIENILKYLITRRDIIHAMLLIEKKGELSPRLMGMVSPDRIDDVIYYAPAMYPFQCNILDFTDDILSNAAFITAFGNMVEMRHSWGLTPNVMSLLRDAMCALKPWKELVTLAHLKSFISDKEFREYVQDNNKDPRVKDFIKNILPKVQPSSKTALFNKLDIFLENPLLSSMCQSNNKLDFRGIIRNLQLIFADLSGLLPEQFADVGTFLFAKATSLVLKKDILLTQNQWFSIVLDEFQEFILDKTLNTVLTQGRSKQVSLFLAHQTLRGQLRPETIATILGNCPVKICFRVAHDDARIMSRNMNVPEDELTSLERFQAYVQVDTLPAVKIQTLGPPKTDMATLTSVLEQSKKKYGADPIEYIDLYAIFNKSNKNTVNNVKTRRYDTL